MKITIQFKDPDALHDVLREAVDATLPDDLDVDEYRSLHELRTSKLREQLTKKWVLWGEYIKVEFDLTNGTATVLPVGN